MSNEVSIKNAVIINFASKYTTIFIQLIYMAVLARMLSPEDFGIIAIITVFTTFFTIFVDMGIGPAIIQNKSLDKDDIESIFSFSFYLAVGLAIVFSLFSIPISMIYNNQVYLTLCPIISLSLFFNTLNSVPNALLMRQKKFVLIGIRLVAITIATSIITIVLALYGFGYYALVLQVIMMALFTFIWNYISAPVTFRFKFKVSSIKKISNYSGYVFAFNFINYFSRNLDNLLIGKVWGAAPLAYYNKAYQLMLYPVQNLTHIITPVLQPILSEHQSDTIYIYEQYQKILKLLSLLGIFISTYCFFASKEIILIVFGSQWEQTIPLFRLLSFSIWAQMINSLSGSMFLVLGKTKLMFIRGVLVAFITVSSIIIGLIIGDLKSVSLFVAISYNLHFITTLYFLVHKSFHQNIIKFCKRLLPDMFIVCIIVIAMMISKILFFDNIIISAIYKGVVCATSYILGLVVTKEYKVFMEFFKKKKTK